MNEATDTWSGEQPEAAGAVAVVHWEAQTDLRYVKRYRQITAYRPDWGDTVSLGQTEHLVLQQLWSERLNGGVEWRDVPLVESPNNPT